jgi:hypothetical protein
LVPYLAGFHPDESLVVIGMSEPKGTVRVTLRYPLQQPGIPNRTSFSIQHAIRVLTSQQCLRAIVVGYGPDDRVASLVDRFRDQTAAHRITLPEILRAADQRYWSYVCTDPACCPPEGTPYELAADPELAFLLAEGVPDVLVSRESLAATVAPVTGADAAAIRRATRRAEARVVRLLEQAPAFAVEPSGRALVVREGIKAMTAAMQRYRDDDGISHGEAAWLTVALRDLQVRDDAWSRLEAAHRKDNLRLLLDLTRLARRGYVAAPATLLAFVAWQSGNGALANVALDRALGDDRNYKLASTLSWAIMLGAPPSMARLGRRRRRCARRRCPPVPAGPSG